MTGLAAAIQTNDELTQPELTLADQVRIEALANGYRREHARQSGSVVRGPDAQSFAPGQRLELIRSIAERMAEKDISERRLDAERKLATPSDLIVEMKRSWPDQAAAVKAFAKREELQLGEAWAKVIAAGVEALHRRRA
jgi:hypothetical protein